MNSVNRKKPINTHLKKTIVAKGKKDKQLRVIKGVEEKYSNQTLG
jgi:hypothetical protein